jgi:hypothetical protein
MEDLKLRVSMSLKWLIQRISFMAHNSPQRVQTENQNPSDGIAGGRCYFQQIRPMLLSTNNQNKKLQTVMKPSNSLNTVQTPKCPRNKL